MPANTATCAVRRSSGVTSHTSALLRSYGDLCPLPLSQVVVPGTLRLFLDDLHDLLDRLIELPVLVHHDIVVLRRRGHLDLRVPQTHRPLLRCLGAAMLEATL